jgi:hypothetical protein
MLGVRVGGWHARMGSASMIDRESFCRLVVSAEADVLLDIAVDSPPILPSQNSPAGPTFGLEELAGRKVVALFDRAEMLGTLRRFADDEIPVPAAEVAAVRSFFQEWRHRLTDRRP